MNELQAVDVAALIASNQMFFAVFVFVVGACIGSFLSVCIWRIPRGEDIVVKPSYCPGCQRRIPFYENIPIVGWLMLGGRCSHCRTLISPRYLLLEVLTGVLFMLAWLRVTGRQWPLPILLPYFVLVGTLIAVSFIDIDYLIIPDGIVLTGSIAALLCGFIWPATHLYGVIDADFFWLAQHQRITFGILELLTHPDAAAFHSPRLFVAVDMFLGLVFGGGFLWLIAEVGKLLFGRRRVRRAQPVDMHLSDRGFREGDDGLQMVPWEDVLVRARDTMRITGELLALERKGERRQGRQGDTGGTAAPGALFSGELTVDIEALTAGDRRVPLAELRHAKVRTCEWVEPREAMGFGDVKLMAMLGLFLGPGAMVFVFVVSALLGAVIGFAWTAGTALVLRRRWKSLIPFGPYIAAAALIYLLRGPELIERYRSLLDVLGR